jgi:hypothetical protein
MRTLILSSLVAAALAAPLAQASAKTVVNPGFESETGFDNSAGTGWQSTVIGGAFTFRGSVYIFEPTEGTLYVSFFGFPAGLGQPGTSEAAGWIGCVASTGCVPGVSQASLKQTVGTTAGQSCRLRFNLGAALGSSAVGTGSVEVLWNGAPVGNGLFAAAEDTPKGTRYVVKNLVANGGDTLEFRLASGALAGVDMCRSSARRRADCRPGDFLRGWPWYAQHTTVRA